MEKDQYDKDRALRLIQDERLLKKMYDKSPFDKDVAIRSIFNSLIKPSPAMMVKYRQTYTETE